MRTNVQTTHVTPRDARLLLLLITMKMHAQPTTAVPVLDVTMTKSAVMTTMLVQQTIAVLVPGTTCLQTAMTITNVLKTSVLKMLDVSTMMQVHVCVMMVVHVQKMSAIANQDVSTILWCVMIMIVVQIIIVIDWKHVTVKDPSGNSVGNPKIVTDSADEKSVLLLDVAPPAVPLAGPKKRAVPALGLTATFPVVVDPSAIDPDILEAVVRDADGKLADVGTIKPAPGGKNSPANQKTVGFVPKKAGLHTVEFSANGEPVATLPVDVIVSKDPSVHLDGSPKGPLPTHDALASIPIVVDGISPENITGVVHDEWK